MKRERHARQRARTRHESSLPAVARLHVTPDFFSRPGSGRGRSVARRLSASPSPFRHVRRRRSTVGRDGPRPTRPPPRASSRRWRPTTRRQNLDVARHLFTAVVLRIRAAPIRACGHSPTPSPERSTCTARQTALPTCPPIAACPDRTRPLRRPVGSSPMGSAQPPRLPIGRGAAARGQVVPRMTTTTGGSGSNLVHAYLLTVEPDRVSPWPRTSASSSSPGGTRTPAGPSREALLVGRRGRAQRNTTANGAGRGARGSSWTGSPGTPRT